MINVQLHVFTFTSERENYRLISVNIYDMTIN